MRGWIDSDIGGRCCICSKGGALRSRQGNGICGRDGRVLRGGRGTAAGTAAGTGG